MIPTAPASPEPVDVLPTCEIDGATVLRVERLRDFDLTQFRLVFMCGHDRYVDPPDARPVFLENERPCTHCAQPKPIDGHRKCDRCRVCTVCGPSHRTHRVAACPRRAVAA